MADLCADADAFPPYASYLCLEICRHALDGQRYVRAVYNDALLSLSPLARVDIWQGGAEQDGYVSFDALLHHLQAFAISKKGLQCIVQGSGKCCWK